MDARLTLKAAASRLEWSEAKMWRIESGLTSMRSHDVLTMCTIYGAPADLTEALMGLAKETKARGWWHSYGDVIPEGFDVFIGLEGAASHLSVYQGQLIPGLLQTEDYARVIIRAHFPDKDEEEIERRVALRVARQTLITRVTAPPTLHVALDEGLLRRPIGGARIMAGQLAHLVEASELAHVVIRVVPCEAGLHQGVLSGSFFIMRFPLNGDGRASEPPTVYADGYTGDLYLDKPKEVERYEAAFGDIWNQSLDEEASRRLISEMAGSYEQG